MSRDVQIDQLIVIGASRWPKGIRTWSHLYLDAKLKNVGVMSPSNLRVTRAYMKFDGARLIIKNLPLLLSFN